MPVGPYLYADDLTATIRGMRARGMFRKLVLYVEACESGSMCAGLGPDEGVLCVTASNADESSWGTYCPPDGDVVGGVSVGSCLGDLFSIGWLEDSSDVGRAAGAAAARGGGNSEEGEEEGGRSGMRKTLVRGGGAGWGGGSSGCGTAVLVPPRRLTPRPHHHLPTPRHGGAAGAVRGGPQPHQPVARQQVWGRPPAVVARGHVPGTRAAAVEWTPCPSTEAS